MVKGEGAISFLDMPLYVQFEYINPLLLWEMGSNMLKDWGIRKFLRVRSATKIFFQIYRLQA